MPVRPPCFDLNGCRRARARTHTCGKVSHVRSRWRGTDNSKKDRSPSSAPREVRAPSRRCVGGEITWSAGQFADTEGWFLFFFNFFFSLPFPVTKGDDLTWTPLKCLLFDSNIPSYYLGFSLLEWFISNNIIFLRIWNK